MLELLKSQKNVAIIGQCRFWAERGLIHVEDGRDNTYKIMSVYQALQHLNGISDMLTKTLKERLGEEYANQIGHEQKFIELMLDILQRAREQGQPFDPSARRDLNIRRPRQFLMPARLGTF